MFEEQYAEAIRNLSLREIAMVEQTPAVPAVYESTVLTRAHELYTSMQYIKEGLGPVLMRHDLFNY
jgi:hypothetical protein